MIDPEEPVLKDTLSHYQKVQVLRLAFVMALKYHPQMNRVTWSTVMAGSQLPSVDTVAGDVFALCYQMSGLFDHHEYPEVVRVFFINVDNHEDST